MNKSELKELLGRTAIFGWPLLLMLQASDFINLIDESNVHWLTKWHYLFEEWLRLVSDFMHSFIELPINFVFGITISPIVRSYFFSVMVFGGFTYRITVLYDEFAEKSGLNPLRGWELFFRKITVFGFIIVWPYFFLVVFAAIFFQKKAPRIDVLIPELSLFLAPFLLVLGFVFSFAITNQAILRGNIYIGLIVGLCLFCALFYSSWYFLKRVGPPEPLDLQNHDGPQMVSLDSDQKQDE